MKRIAIILFFLISVAYAQKPQTIYEEPTISAMKLYSGYATRIHVTATNEDYIICPGCTADEVNVFQGAGGRKWKKFLQEALEEKANQLDVLDIQFDLQTNKADKSVVNDHIANTSNPHNVTLSQVGYDSAVDHGQIWEALNQRLTSASLVNVAYKNTANTWTDFNTWSRAGDQYLNAINTTSGVQTGFGSTTVGFVGTISGHSLEFRTNNVARLSLAANGDITTPNNITVTKTTEQLRLRYDASNYLSTTVGSNAVAVYDVIGSSPTHIWNTAGTRRLALDGSQLYFRVGILPDNNNLYDVGSSSLRFKDAYFSGIITAPTVSTDQLYNTSGGSNSRVTLLATGTTISRNIADANATLIVNNIHASSTGAIFKGQFGGVDKFVIDKDGNLTAGIVPDARLSSNVALKNANNNFSVAQNIQNASVGNWATDANYAVFKHKDMATNDYAFMQGPSGDANFNAKSGLPISFRFSNIENGRWTGTGLYIGGGANASATLHVNGTALISGAVTLSNLANAASGYVKSSTTGVLSRQTAIPQSDVTDLTNDLSAKQPLDADLTTIAGLTATTDNFLVGVSSAWASRTPVQVKTTLALDNVNNTSDLDKPISTVTQDSLTAHRSELNKRYSAGWDGKNIIGTWIPTIGSSAFIQTVINQSGTGATTATPTTTNLFSSKLRIHYVTAGTATANAGLKGNFQYLYRDNGFTFKTVVGNASAATVATQQMFAGLTSATALHGAGVNPGSRTNLIGIGKDDTDTNWQIIYNDGSGSASKIDLGSDYPATTLSTDFYEATFEANSSGVTYTVYRVNVPGQAPVTGTITTDLPAGTQGLSDHAWVSNGSTALAAAIAVFFQSVKF